MDLTPTEQMVRLLLKGSNKTFDSLRTDYKAEDYSFTILANTFKDRTKQEWDKTYLLSFGLVTGAGNLTNAGALFADDCPLWQSRLYCYGMERKRAMPSMTQSLQAMSSCCFVKLYTVAVA